MFAQKPISVIDFPACNSAFQAKPFNESTLPFWVADAPQTLFSVPVIVVLVVQVTVLLPLLVTTTLAQYPEFQSLVIFTNAVTLLPILDVELVVLDETDADELIAELTAELLLELTTELATELATDEVVPHAETTPKGAGCVLQVFRAIQLF